jgi:hypothetical protein
MSAPPLYHGTRRPFQKGGLVLPAKVTGAKFTEGGVREDEGEHVYVTPDWQLAATFARMANGRGRPRILTVKPLSKLEVDWATFGGEEREAYRCEAAIVEKVEIIEEGYPWL